MKRFFTLSAVVLATLFAASVVSARTFGGDKPVTRSKLPQQARSFLISNYGNTAVSYATVDREIFDTTYDVTLEDGTQLEFAKDGDWMEITCGRNGAIPLSALPVKIRSYVEKNYPKASVRKIERDGREYDVALSNGVDLIFDHHFDLLHTNDYYKHQPDHRFTWQ